MAILILRQAPNSDSPTKYTVEGQFEMLVVVVLVVVVAIVVVVVAAELEAVLWKMRPDRRREAF